MDTKSFTTHYKKIEKSIQTGAKWLLIIGLVTSTYKTIVSFNTITDIPFDFVHHFGSFIMTVGEYTTDAGIFLSEL